MNENINLVEILRDCPKGTKFYSTVYGNITLDSIDINKPSIFCIHMIEDDGNLASFTKKGKIYNIEDGECVIFPSKNQRDWNIWKIEQDRKNVWDKFEDGDYLWMKQKDDYWVFIYRKNIKGERVQGYGCFSQGWDTDYYTDIMEDYQYIGTKDEVLEVRKATIEQIALFDIEFQKRYNKKWNPITKKFEGIKTEMTISEIEKKLGLTSGSLRIKK